jgi:rSAM/selenodomain-associated transferase 2
MDLSIIIPAVNEEARIQRAIESAWTAGADEVLVVDGGSRDGTIAVSGTAGAVVLEAPRGRAIQQNRGADVAQGKLLLFLHADNWLSSETRSQLRRVLEQPEVGSGAFFQQIQSSSPIFRWVERGNAWRVRQWGIPYGDQGIFVRRDLFLEVGGFPEVPLMEDVALMRQLRRRSRPILLPGPIYVDARRWQRHGVVRQTLRNWSLLSAYRLGVSPARLAQAYRAHDHPTPSPNSQSDRGTSP